MRFKFRNIKNFQIFLLKWRNLIHLDIQPWSYPAFFHSKIYFYLKNIRFFQLPLYFSKKFSPFSWKIITCFITFFAILQLNSFFSWSFFRKKIAAWLRRMIYYIFVDLKAFYHIDCLCVKSLTLLMVYKTIKTSLTILLTARH